MQKVKKIPQRQCVGCREMKDKKDLIRVVKSPEGVISIDDKGKAPGRGAYICRSEECLNKAHKAKLLDKNLETEISQEVFEMLKERSLCVAI